MDNVAMFRLLATTLLIIGSGKPVHELLTENEEEEKLRRLEERIFRHILKEYPEFATHLGVHDYDDELESFSPEAFERRKAECENILREIQQINVSLLSTDARRDYKIFSSYVNTYLEGFAWMKYGDLNPLNFLDKTSRDQTWIYIAKYRNEEDYEIYFKRIAGIPKKVEQQIELMKTAIRLNRTSHIVSVSRLPEVLSPSTVQAPYYYPMSLEGVAKSIHRDKWKEIRYRIQDVISKQISPSFKKLKRFIEEEYIPATRPKEGLYSLENGLRYYEACLKWYLGYNMTPTEIYNLGISEIKRIEKLMKQVMLRLNFHGTPKEFFRHLKNMPGFYNSTVTEFLNGYHDIIKHRVNPVLFQIFKKIPLKEVSVVGVSNDSPWGAYGKNKFLVNIKWPEERSNFTMLPLTLHEANPGHHFQVSYSKAHSIPNYRRHFVSGKYYSVPLALPTYATYMEGWATYAEYLGEELNLYKDPYELFGRYCLEIFRAVRLVVDPGIHAFRWSRERAINFILNYTEFPRSQVEIEVDRYITWPGQACSYKLGEMKIKELRLKAETELGSNFNLKEFHHQVLKYGRMSLDVLEDVIFEWIRSVQQMVKKGAAQSSSAPTVFYLSNWRALSSVVALILSSRIVVSHLHNLFCLNPL